LHPKGRIKMSQGLNQVQKQSQQMVQTLSPQQIQVVKLLELPTLEFEDRIRTELQDNPALDESNEDAPDDENDDEYSNTDDAGDSSASEENSTLDDYSSPDDIPDYQLRQNNGTQPTRAEDIPFSDATSFYEKLTEQLGEQDLNDTDYKIGEYLIGSLDEDGMLRKDLNVIVDELAIYNQLNVPLDEVKKVLQVIQTFDPAGIGAQSLQECLLLQVERRPKTDLTENMCDILTHCYDEFTKKHNEKIMQRLDMSEGEFNNAMFELVRLNPRPGVSLSESLSKPNQTIIPDFIVDTLDDGAINLSLNDRNVPMLRVNHDYMDMMRDFARNKDKMSKDRRDSLMFLKQKVDSAQSFIDAVHQRQHTLLSTMQAIIDIQHDFFVEGDPSLIKPMILKDVADRTHLDISTISRVSNSKYVQCNFGIFSLKHFFGDGFITDNGEELSAREIRRILKEEIDKEDKNNALTDDELAEILKKQGYSIARRTVAKYRQQLNIPVARLR